MFTRFKKLFSCCQPHSFKDDGDGGAHEATFETEKRGKHASHNGNEATEAKEEFKHDEGNFNTSAKTSKTKEEEGAEEECKQVGLHDSVSSELATVPTKTMAERHHLIQAKKRATQRFTSLVTAKKSRLAEEQGMREHLGKKTWKQFCVDAEAYRLQWKARFGRRMECCGNLQGKPCPHRIVVDPRCSLNALGGLHLDHSIEVVTICRAWRQAVGSNPATWHQGIDKEYLLHLLFGLEVHKNFQNTGDMKWNANIHFRCGNTNNRKEHQLRDRKFCHDTAHPHSQFTLHPNDLLNGK